MFLFRASKFLRQYGVTDFASVEIDQVYADAMFHLAFTELVQVRPPLAVMSEIFSNPAGKENVAGIAAIHYALRHVDSGAGDVGAPIYVANAVDRATVHAHS